MKKREIKITSVAHNGKGVQCKDCEWSSLLMPDKVLIARCRIRKSREVASAVRECKDFQFCTQQKKIDYTPIPLTDGRNNPFPWNW